MDNGSPLPPAIRTEHLTKIYADRLIAVNDMNLAVPRGAIFGLFGPNGAGKTTTTRILLGLQKPTAGHAEIFGQPCGANAAHVRAMIGYLPTNPKLPEHLRPVEYLDLLGRLCRLPAEVRKPRIASLLRAVGLLATTDRRIGTLSTGETTRLGIAASLIADPPLLIWDEPTAGLDPAARRFTLDLIRQLGTNRTVVIATHILSDIDQICDHVGVMHQGRMIFAGSMDDMKRRLRPSDIRLSIDAEDEAVSRLAVAAAEIEGAAIEAAGRTLSVRVIDAASRARVLAEVLRLVDVERLALQSIHSGENETENAYLQLLQEDEAHGFRRFELPARPAVDAAGSHTRP